MWDEQGFFTVNSDYRVLDASPHISAMIGHILWNRHPLARETFQPFLGEAWASGAAQAAILWCGRLINYVASEEAEHSTLRVEYHVLEHVDFTNLRTLSESFDRIMEVLVSSATPPASFTVIAGGAA